MNKCRAIVSIGDDQYDDVCTFKCQNKSGHEGLHTSSFINDGKNLTITWDGTEKVCIDKFKFKLTLCNDEHRIDDDNNELETVVTGLLSLYEVTNKYALARIEGNKYIYRNIKSYEPIEGTKVSEWIYEDELKDK